MSYQIFFEILVTLIAIICTSTYGVKRNITCVVNPGYDESYEEVSDMNIVHVIADSGEDLVHYVWSSYKVPSVIVARTSRDSELKINRTKLKNFESGAIWFSKEPFESIGMTISELWEMNYTKDASEITDSNLIERVGMESFKWTDAAESLVCSESLASLTLKASGDNAIFSKNGTVGILFSVVGDEIRSSEFPHLYFNGNSTEIKIILDHLRSNSSRSRYGFEINLGVTSLEECPSEMWKKITSTSVNDEFSPGVFTDVELLPPCSTEEEANKTFITWRPVAYTGEVPVVANSSDANMTTDCMPTYITAPHSIAEIYIIEKGNFSAFNITFGTVGDGFYPKTEYTSWALMIGSGCKIETGLSGVIIIFLTVGLGALVLFFVGGVLYMTCRRCFLKDDDLLLSDSSIN